MRVYLVRMYWPLIGGFIVFVLIAVFLGWLMDTSRRGDGTGPGAGH